MPNDAATAVSGKPKLTFAHAQHGAPLPYLHYLLVLPFEGKGKIPPTQPATKTADAAKKGKKKGLKHTESNANHKRKQLNLKSKPTKDAKKAKKTTSAKAGTIIPDWNHDDA